MDELVSNQVCFLVCVRLCFFMFVFVLQMSPLKKSATKKSSKCQRTSSNSFWSDDANMAFNDHYKRAPIILERTVDLRVLRRHFHFWSVQGKDMFKVVEPNGQGLWRNHSRILCQCHCGKGSHKLLAKREKVLSQGRQFKRYWWFIQRLHTHPYNMLREGRN